MMRHLKGLIFDCHSFTEVLITFLFIAEDEAPVFNSRSTTSVWPVFAAR